MENFQQKPIDWSYEKALQRKETQLAIQEAEIIIHLSEFGKQPEIGIPLFDAFIEVGCPCRQCFRDEFIS